MVLGRWNLTRFTVEMTVDTMVYFIHHLMDMPPPSPTAISVKMYYRTFIHKWYVTRSQYLMHLTVSQHLIPLCMVWGDNSCVYQSWLMCQVPENKQWVRVSDMTHRKSWALWCGPSARFITGILPTHTPTHWFWYIWSAASQPSRVNPLIKGCMIRSIYTHLAPLVTVHCSL